MNYLEVNLDFFENTNLFTILFLFMLSNLGF